MDFDNWQNNSEWENAEFTSQGDAGQLLPTTESSQSSRLSFVDDNLPTREIRKTSTFSRHQSQEDGEKRKSEPLVKRRFSVLAQKHKAHELAKSLTAMMVSSKEPAKLPTAAELCYDAAFKSSNPQKEIKDQLIRQYHMWKGLDVRKIDLPPLTHSIDKTKVKISDQWVDCKDAARQLRKGARRPQQNLTSNSFDAFVPTTRHSDANYCGWPRSGLHSKRFKDSMDQLLNDIRGLL